MNWLIKLRLWLEYLGGVSDAPPAGTFKRGWLALAVWWALLACLIAIFCGQTSKFIYIDF